MYCKTCKWCAEKVGAINLWANVGILSVKLCGGIFGKSQALIADAFHSVGDIAAALLVFLGLKVSVIPPDRGHPWGHGLIEFIVSVVIGILLVFCAITIVTVSFVSIIRGRLTEPTILAVWAALISIIANGLLSRHSLCIGRQVDSPTMIANAWENRADVFSSSASLVGVFGARLGFYALDPLAAIVVGFLIAKFGGRVMITGVRGMTDYSLDPTVLSEIRKIALKDEGVKEVGKIKGRKIGQKKWVDMEILFDGKINVGEAKKISERLRESVEGKIERIGGINIRIVNGK